MSRWQKERARMPRPALNMQAAPLTGEALLRALTGVQTGEPLAGMDAQAVNLTLLVVACEAAGHRPRTQNGRLPYCLDCGAFLVLDWHGWRAVHADEPPAQ